MNWNARQLLAAGYIVSAVFGFCGATLATVPTEAALEGEIVDVSCYVGLPQHGHPGGKCTKSCLLDGTPIGLATADGTLYLLLENLMDKKPYQIAKQTPAQKVRVIGRVNSRGGFHTLTVERFDILGQEAAACTDRAPAPGISAPGYCGEN